jgi:hypothetical protein
MTKLRVMGYIPIWMEQNILEIGMRISKMEKVKLTLILVGKESWPDGA